MENDMFLNGERLKKRLSQLDKDVRDATGGDVRYEEHIAIPAYGGQIIVRFTTESRLDADAIDELERRIRELAKDDFLIDFMGSVYRQMGVDYGRLDEIAKRLGQRFKSEPMYRGPFAEHIEADARTLLLRCGLPQNAPVWEIQWEDEEYVLLLMGDENRMIRTVESQPRIHVMETNGALCEGFMRATFAAKRMGISLGRLMLEAMEG